ncbi:ATP-binding protein [Streptomyces beihaiensis]|uniref:hypothetical protein n=1 Tax=Streptomyces beihaiensis TaxID=2984495 RepID=UPI002B1CDAB0|nr:hypothetical protein [Streptomyces beihaiensis]
MGEHSVRHLRRILRLHLAAWHDGLAESGRGLTVVAEVTSRWGVPRHGGPGGGKTVWFECDRPATGKP